MTENARESLSNRWFALGLLLLIFIFNYADRFLISGLVSTIKADFGLGDSFMGLLMGPAFVVLYILAGIPIARLADRHSRVAIIATGCIVWSLFTGMTGLAVGPISLALCRVGVGVGEAALVAPAYSLLSSYFPPRERGIAFAIIGLASYFGQIGGYLVGPAIAGSFGWQSAFFAMALPGVLLGLAALVFLREPQRNGKVAVEGLVHVLRQMAAAKSYLALMIGMGFGTLSGVSFGFWGPTVLARNHGVGEAVAGNAFATYFGVSGLAGTLLFGVISDRLAVRDPAGPARLAAASLFAATFCILLVTWSDDFARSKLLAVPSGLLGGGWSVGVMASLQFLLPDRHRATATASFVAVTTMLGFLAGPWLAGTMSDFFGGAGHSLRLGLTFTIPAGFAGAWLIWASARTLHQDRDLLAARELGLMD